MTPMDNAPDLTSPHPAYQGLVYSVFQRTLLTEATSGVVVAVVAAHPGAGTTHLTHMLATSLKGDGDSCALAITYEDLVTASAGEAVSGAAVSAKDAPALLTDPVECRRNWHGSRGNRLQRLTQFRKRFRYVLIDCPSLKESADVLAIAPLVDGVLLIVEANRTSKRQVTYLEQTVEGAGGKILGHILNRRTYKIPSWLFRRLNQGGL